MNNNTFIMVSTASGDISAVHFNLTNKLGAKIFGVLEHELFIRVEEHGNGYSLKDVKRRAKEAAEDARVMIGDFVDGEIIPYDIPTR